MPPVCTGFCCTHVVMERVRGTTLQCTVAVEYCLGILLHSVASKILHIGTIRRNIGQDPATMCSVTFCGNVHTLTPTCTGAQTGEPSEQSMVLSQPSLLIVLCGRSRLAAPCAKKFDTSSDTRTWSRSSTRTLEGGAPSHRQPSSMQTYHRLFRVHGYVHLVQRNTMHEVLVMHHHNRQR